MIAIAKMVVVLLALIDVQVSVLDGPTIAGKLQQLDAENAVIAAADGTQTTVAVASMIDVKFVLPEGEAVPQSSASLQAVLRDGSVLPVSQAEASATTVTMKSDLLGDLKISRPAVRALLLQELRDEWKPQWDAFLERNNTKDLLIVAKRDDSGLDFLAGVVSSVGAEVVPFLLDGDEIPVARSRVFGVVFSATDNASTQLAGDLSLQLTGDFSVRAGSVIMEGEQFRFETSWGQSLSIAADRLTAIDFSNGRLHYLSDLEPLSERYFGLDPPGREWGALFSEDLATRTGLSSQWRMSRDRFPNNGRPRLTLRGQVYRKGLCIFPKAAIEYALDGKYSKLTAVVGVDDDVAFNQQKGRAPTAVELRVMADGEELLKRLINAPDEPFVLDLKLTGVTTLALIVDFGDGESTCDYLDLADARLIVDTSEK